MSDATGNKQRFVRRVLMVILGLVLVLLIASLVYLLRDFQHSLHDLPH